MADVLFSLDGGSTYSFGLHARNGDGYQLTASMDRITTSNINVRGSYINLAWNPNGNTPFILSGSNGAFWSNNPGPSWMEGMLPVIGNKPLRHIVIPGSHDAGMSTITGGTGFGNAMDCQTQSQNIGQQLENGARYFDLRPTISSGQFVSGHYSNTGNSIISWQGANGESFDDIIAQVNAYTEYHNELIILSTSHMLNTDVGEGNYRSLTSDEASSLLAKLSSSINHLYVAPDPNMDISLLSLNDFIGNNQPAVVVIVDSGYGLGQYLGQGFYTPGQFNVTNSYSNSDDYNSMRGDQLSKLFANKPNADSVLFLLSWTLTQQPEDIIESKSILSLAATANNGLYTDVFSYVKSSSLPNIIYVDNFDSSDITAFTIALNHAYATKTSDKPQRRSLHKKRLSSTTF